MIRSPMKRPEYTRPPVVLTWARKGKFEPERLR